MDAGVAFATVTGSCMRCFFRGGGKPALAAEGSEGAPAGVGAAFALAGTGNAVFAFLAGGCFVVILLLGGVFGSTGFFLCGTARIAALPAVGMAGGAEVVLGGTAGFAFPACSIPQQRVI